MPDSLMPATTMVPGAAELAAALERMVADGSAAGLPDEALQPLMAALVRVIGVKFDTGQRPTPIAPENSGVSPTATLVAVSALLRAANLEIFELGMWQSWSGSR